MRRLPRSVTAPARRPRREDNPPTVQPNLSTTALRLRVARPTGRLLAIFPKSRHYHGVGGHPGDVRSDTAHSAGGAGAAWAHHPLPERPRTVQGTRLVRRLRGFGADRRRLPAGVQGSKPALCMLVLSLAWRRLFLGPATAFRADRNVADRHLLAGSSLVEAVTAPRPCAPGSGRMFFRQMIA